MLVKRGGKKWIYYQAGAAATVAALALANCSPSQAPLDGGEAFRARIEASSNSPLPWIFGGTESLYPTSTQGSAPRWRPFAPGNNNEGRKAA